MTPLRLGSTPRWSPRRVAWIGGLLIAAMVAQAAYDIARGYEDTVRATEKNLDTQSRVIAEQAARGIQAIDVVLRHLAEQIGRGALADADADKLHAYLKEQAVGLVQSDGLVVFRADGSIRAVSQVPIARVPPLNVAKDPPFANLREQPGSGLTIEPTIKSPGTQRWVFPIGRRVVDREGRFAGVVGAPGRVDYFQQFYRDAYPDPSTRISLLHGDGWLLARQPPIEAAFGRHFDLDDIAPPRGSELTAMRRRASPIDGVDHFVALRRVPDYPLVVAVSRDAVAALAPWRAQAVTTASRTLVLAALASVMLWIALKHLIATQAARRSLEVSQERYALAAAGSDTGVWDWDLAAGSAYESRRARELQGLPLEPETQPLDELRALLALHPDDVAPRELALQAHLDGATPFYEVEYRVRRGDGSYAWIHVRALCVRDAAGRPLRIAGSVSDVDARKRAEEQLRQAQKLEAIGTLAGGIAHDFNNILSAILGYGDLALKHAAEGTPIKRHVEAAMAAGQRAKSLVERILAFSRSGMGERAAVHVQAVVDEALDAVAAALPAGVRLERRLDAGDAGLLGDATQIHQVVMNLCANAQQAIKAEGRIEVTLEAVALDAPLAVATSTLPPGRYLKLAVADTGSGIAPELIERIFDPFFTTKEIGVGTGLGLSLVHGIVTDLAGGIAVHSRRGEGSRFTVWLPSIGPVAAPAAAGAADDAERGEGQTILLIDDEEALVRLGEETLAELGYEPLGFTSAQAALEALGADPARFDALLTDEAMPGLTGTQVVRAARALRPDLPVVMMSGYVTPALQQRAREAGASEVLAKPLAAPEIARALAAALHGLREAKV